ncbi:MAG: hypothetical protein CL666_09875 [Balneola sp.]|nr:hypothetical protein [Balneola sp.]|tara:strand:- start:32363 stop:33463 length:1101 start_codon:yes stop_codon:yes gene_type:complete
MLTNLRIENFKPIKQMEVELTNLNLLLGLNGMGKSSLIQSLLLLRQSSDLSDGVFELNGDLAKIGVGRDAMYQFNDTSESINISLKEHSVDQEFSWKFKYASDAEILETEDIYTRDTLDELSLFNDNFNYLSAERIPPTDGHIISTREVINSHQVGVRGEYTIHFLNVFGDIDVDSDLVHKDAKSSSLLHQVDAWLSEISPGTRLKTFNVPSLELIRMGMEFETDSDVTNVFKPKNVGFGLSYALPVITALLSAKKGALVVIENPESHIHPKGQAQLGMLIAKVASLGVQLLIETHSDHVVNGIRVATKNEYIDYSKVRLNFFDKVNKDFEQYSVNNVIKLDSNGELSDYPEHLLDEWNNQLLKLV